MESVDTIIAVASGAGKSGVGVVRVSGPLAKKISEGILGAAPDERRATYKKFLSADAETIDSGIAILFLSPRSYTGEDTLELQGHGGPAVLQAIVNRCLDLGARLAEPGEFTKRAFLNNKLDLVQAESVIDVIEASSQQAVLAAQRSLSGKFSEAIEHIKNELIEIRMYVEAGIDFPEEDLDLVELKGIGGRLILLQDKIAKLVAEARRGRALRDGITLALVGPPNVGKSSLMNQLVGEDASIVTNVPGTTRDTIFREISIDGYPIHIADTAGLRDTADLVEQLGIERTKKAIEQSDLIINISTHDGDSHDESELPKKLKNINVINKIDELGQASSRTTSNGIDTIRLSAKTGDGLDLLRESILQAVGVGGADEAAFTARQRHIDALSRAGGFLNRAASSLSNLDICAEELRYSQQSLSEITGEFLADDLLGEIFSRFCIGK